jgi:hypothetical protein
MSRRTTSFPTLEEYGNDFLEFVNSSPDLIPVDLHSNYLSEVVARRTRSVVDLVNEKAMEFLATGRKLGPRRLRSFISESIVDARTAWDNRQDGPWATQLSIPGFAKSHRAEIDTQIARVLQLLPATIAHRGAIRTLIVESLKKLPITGEHTPIDPRSGIVIAGFGEREFFPRLISYDLFGTVDGVLRASPNPKVEISVHNPAVIAPFAQREMVDGFMTGINPQVRAALMGYMNGVANNYPQATLELLQRQIPGLDPALAASLTGPLSSLISIMVRELEQHLDQSLETQVQPVLDSVDFLPKDELAAMAESLVNLTSLKRRVSIDDPQTVGGPVDVAVISRGDGFVWIKRKHYFSQDLNPAWVSTHTEY